MKEVQLMPLDKWREWGPGGSLATQLYNCQSLFSTQAILLLSQYWLSIRGRSCVFNLFFPLSSFFHSISSHLSAKIFQVQPRCLSAQTHLGKPHAHLQGCWHAAAGLSILWPQDVRLWLHWCYGGHFSKWGLAGGRERPGIKLVEIWRLPAWSQYLP